VRPLIRLSLNLTSSCSSSSNREGLTEGVGERGIDSGIWMLELASVGAEPSDLRLIFLVQLFIFFYIYIYTHNLLAVYFLQVVKQIRD
jgi:hypothetical protein